MALTEPGTEDQATETLPPPPEGILTPPDATNTSTATSTPASINPPESTFTQRLPGATAPVGISDILNEARKIGSNELDAYRGLLNLNLEDIGQGLNRQLYGKNIGAGEGRLGQLATREAIERQNQRLAPMAQQIAERNARLALDEQMRREAENFQLVKSGQLTGQSASDILARRGINPQEFSNDVKYNLDQLALASGMTPDDYLRVKAAIGQGQLNDVLTNPQDYIDSPGAQRRFQESIAKMQSDAMLKASELQSNAAITAAQITADSVRGAAGTKLGADLLSQLASRQFDANSRSSLSQYASMMDQYGTPEEKQNFLNQFTDFITGGKRDANGNLVPGTGWFNSGQQPDYEFDMNGNMVPKFNAQGFGSSMRNTAGMVSVANQIAQSLGIVDDGTGKQIQDIANTAGIVGQTLSMSPQLASAFGALAASPLAPVAATGAAFMAVSSLMGSSAGWSPQMQEINRQKNQAGGRQLLDVAINKPQDLYDNFNLQLNSLTKPSWSGENGQPEYRTRVLQYGVGTDATGVYDLDKKLKYTLLHIDQLGTFHMMPDGSIIPESGDVSENIYGKGVDIRKKDLYGTAYDINDQKVKFVGAKTFEDKKYGEQSMPSYMKDKNHPTYKAAVQNFTKIAFGDYGATMGMLSAAKKILAGESSMNPKEARKLGIYSVRQDGESTYIQTAGGVNYRMRTLPDGSVDVSFVDQGGRPIFFADPKSVAQNGGYVDPYDEQEKIDKLNVKPPGLTPLATGTMSMPLTPPQGA